MENEYIFELIFRFVFIPLILIAIGIACIPSPVCSVFFTMAVAFVSLGVLAYFDIKSQK